MERMDVSYRYLIKKKKYNSLSKK